MHRHCVKANEGIYDDQKSEKRFFQPRDHGFVGGGSRRNDREKERRKRLCGKHVEDGENGINKTDLFMRDQREGCWDYKCSSGQLACNAV